MNLTDCLDFIEMPPHPSVRLVIAEETKPDGRLTWQAR